MAQANGVPRPPPTFSSTINEIRIPAEKETKVTGVTVYTGRAEVTREVIFQVGTGQNKVIITGLSSYLDGGVRVEGRGAGTIQGVTVSSTRQPPTVTTSPTIEAIREKQTEIEAAVERCKRNRDAVYKYLETLNAQHVDAEKLSGIIHASEENLERLDKKMTGLKKELDASKKEIDQERTRLNPPSNHQLQKEVEVGVFADRDGKVTLVLKYAVRNATWDATYDARVNTQTMESPLKLIYQAKITQNTGENWDDIPMLLETNTPTFNVSLPPLPIHQLHIKGEPKDKDFKKRKSKVMATSWIHSKTAEALEESEEDDDMGFALFDDEPAPALATTVGSVYNKGGVGTTYRIPGLVTIPPDNNAHNITIVEVKLDATFSWVTVPKLDTRAHLQAKVKNTSDFILINGSMNTYVDGTFNSQSNLSTTNPQETFNISLGLDPAVRVTYHPRVEKQSQSGLITKSTSKISTQRITIQNTKPTPISTLKVIDGIPVSQDARITVKLKNPELVLPGLATTIQRTISIGGAGSIQSGFSGNGGGSGDDGRKIKNLPAPTKISDKPVVYAQWHGADEDGVQVDSLGQDGRLNWIISDLGSMETLNLVLKWEVGRAEGLEVVSKLVSST